MPMSKSERHAEQWWLSGGHEECPHCGQLYAYEVELRCFDCDGPICPQCIVRFGRRSVCLDCSGGLSDSAAQEHA